MVEKAEVIINGRQGNYMQLLLVQTAVITETFAHKVSWSFIHCQMRACMAGNSEHPKALIPTRLQLVASEIHMRRTATCRRFMDDKPAK